MTGAPRTTAPAAFRLLYTLAFFGAHLAFIPLLVLLLPRRVDEIAGADATSTLSLLLIAGAITASIANVAAGHASDRWFSRHGHRRVPIAFGLGLLAVSYVGLAAAGTFLSLMVAMVFFQVGLNAMFAPLGALLSDHVSDQQKAQTSAWLTMALPVSIAVCGPVGTVFPSDGWAAFSAVAAAVTLCVLPLLLLWPAVGPATPSVTAHRNDVAPPALVSADFRRAFLARFLVQCGAALVLFYVYVYLRQLPAAAGVPPDLSAAAAVLATAGGLAGALAVLAVGRMSDWLQQRRWPIALSGAVTAAGLLLLAAEPAWLLVILAYALFNAGLMTFLSVDSAMIAQMLSDHPSRGKLLGYMNLTNTLPGIVTPLLTLLTLQVASGESITILLAASAFATAISSLLIMRMKSIR